MMKKTEIDEKIQNIDFTKIDPKEETKTVDPKADGVENFSRNLLSEESKWTDKLEGYSKSFRRIQDLIDLQILIYADRQLLVESKSKYVSTKIKIEKYLRQQKKDAYIDAKQNQNYQLKYNNELNIFMEDYMRDYLQKYEFVTMHIDFLIETIRTIDNIIFGIRNRIQIEQIMNND